MDCANDLSQRRNPTVLQLRLSTVFVEKAVENAVLIAAGRAAIASGPAWLENGRPFNLQVHYEPRICQRNRWR